MKNSELIIFHGSISIIEKPQYGIGKPYNDYGLGFYCTESLDLAKEWAVDKTHDGYANKYSLNINNLKILNLSKEGNVLNWIAILLKNRTFNLKNDIAKAGKEYLIKHFSLPIEEYDVVIGYRADDSYFAYADAFVNNAISVRSLKEALKLGNLGEQVVLISKKAFSQLSYLGSEKAESFTYYPLREMRNNTAREGYIKCKTAAFKQDDLFLNDIMKGIDKNDPRL